MMTSMSHRAAASVLVLVVLVYGGAIFAVANAEEPKSHPVLLGRGTLSDYAWSVAVARDSGKQGGQRPCLIISQADTRSSEGFSGYTKNCSSLPSSGSPFILSDTAGEGKREMTVFGMAAVPKIASADLDFGLDGHMHVRLKQLNSVQQRNAAVRPLRYVAFALKGDRCLRQFKGYSLSGKEIFRGPVDECTEAAQ